jgi:hypothetical protein
MEYCFDMRGLALAIQRHDQGEPDRDLGRGDGDDKENHDLAGQVVVEPGKRHQREIGGIEHQLEGHVNDQEIAPHDDPEQAHAKQGGAHD